MLEFFQELLLGVFLEILQTISCSDFFFEDHPGIPLKTRMGILPEIPPMTPAGIPHGIPLETFFVIGLEIYDGIPSEIFAGRCFCQVFLLGLFTAIFPWIFLEICLWILPGFFFVYFIFKITFGISVGIFV